MPACIKGLLDHVVRIEVLVRVDFGSELLFDISEIGILTGQLILGKQLSPGTFREDQDHRPLGIQAIVPLPQHSPLLLNGQFGDVLYGSSEFS